MKKFLVPSLLAAGFLSPPDRAMAVSQSFGDDREPAPLLQKLQLSHVFTLAGHSSHSSHSSHASHASHRSSVGGGYSAPRYPAPAVPDPAPLTTLPGNSSKFKNIVIQVELALQSYGYYDGPIDGVIGKTAKAALTRFQTDYKLVVTGTVTPEVLTALNIVAN